MLGRTDVYPGVCLSLPTHMLLGGDKNIESVRLMYVIELGTYLLIVLLL